MENLRILAKNLDQKNEIISMFVAIGYAKDSFYSNDNDDLMGIHVYEDGPIQDVLDEDYNDDEHKEVSLPELRALVSLHKNPINMDKVLSEVRSDALGLLKDKEYLNKETYEFVRSSSELNDTWMEIPEWADCYAVNNGHHMFFSNIDLTFEWSVLWQRQTHPEELPFVDNECYTNKSNGGFKMPKDKPCDISKWSEIRGESISDQYAEIEQVRQEHKSNHTGSDLPDFLFEDTVNHPSHYASGEIECIDAMEAMLTPEQFIGYLRGNALKYQWRYENKGGITDLEKAQWYLNKLISRIS